jgi:hypothetical protein
LLAGLYGVPGEVRRSDLVKQLSIGALAVAICLGAWNDAWAQAGQQGSVTGTVIDAQGGALPGVTVAAVNASTNVTSTAVTNESGLYLLTGLNYGRYRFTYTLGGFTPITREIEVRTGDRLRVDVTLQLGGVAETVQVTDETPLLETQTATRTTVIDTAKLESLPISGRNVFTLVHLTPGVLDDGSTRPSISRRPFDNGGMDSISINGGVTRSNLFLLDGGSNTAAEGGQAGSLAYVPPVEAVEEVRVSSNVYDAQYGRTGGGVVNVTVRNGTNRLSGSASYLHRDKNLGAQLYQDRDLPKTDLFHYNPAFTMGGPVVLPSYNGRDRTFFFGSYEYLSSKIPNSSNLQRVPTPLELNGDFSQSNTTIYDPLTRQPFPGNVIPADRVDPISKTIATYMLQENLAPDAQGNNYRAPSSSRGDTYHSYLGKITQNMGNHRMFVTFAHNTRHEVRALNGRDQITATGTPNHYRWNNTVSFDWTTPIGPSMVSTFKAGWTNHNRRDGLIEGFQFDSAALGFGSSYLNMIPRKNYFHPVSIADYNGAGVGTANNTHLTLSHVFNASQVVTKIVGRHQIKIGGEFQMNRDETGISTGGADVGAFNFTRHWTSLRPNVTNLTAADGGNSFASFLLGYPRDSRIILGVKETLNWSSQYLGAYVQDDWRVNNRLTLNLGLRWDVETPTRERDGLVVGGFAFDEATPLSCPACAAAAARPDINNPALANLQGGLLFTDGGIYETDWNNIGPRVGLTFQVNQRVVFRAGAGVSYLNGSADRGTTNGVTATTTYVASLDGNLTPRANLSETRAPLYPSGLIQPVGDSLGLLSNVGSTANFHTRDRELQRYVTYNAGAQFQLPWRSVLDVNYVGSRTQNQPITLQLNELTAAQIALGDAFLDELVPNPFAGLLPGTTLNNATIAREQLLRPFPQFSSVSQQLNPLGKLLYHSLQTTWEKRLSHGVNMLVSYTYSGKRELTNPLNQGDPLFEQFAVDHRPHVFRVSGGWTAPALDNRSAWVRGVLGGWQISTATFYSQGRSTNMPANVDVIGDYVLDNPTKARWFNTCTLGADGVTRSFCAGDTEQPAFQLRPNNARDTTGARLEGVYQHAPMLLDLSFSKTIKGFGSSSYQIRMDLYNAFNTVQWGQPNTTPTNANFGTVSDNQANDPLFAMLTFKASF